VEYVDTINYRYSVLHLASAVLLTLFVPLLVHYQALFQMVINDST